MKKLALFFATLALCLYSCSDKETWRDRYEPIEPPQEEEEEPQPQEPTVSTGELPHLRVDGKYLKNDAGKVVNLHGFTQTYSPFFNNNAWGNHDVAACLAYNQKMLDGIIAAGWKFNFVRMHLDPYWSDDPNQESVRYEGHERFSEERFRKYLDELFIPMAKYFVSKGYYVVMRPPGVCPEQMALNDSYHRFLKKVWGILSRNSYIKNNTDIMFELANEPISMLGTDGNYAHWTEASWENNTKFFQEVVDVIRKNGCTQNVIWVPGLCWQQQYKGYAKYKIDDNNFGFAVHCYPGWYGSDSEDSTGEGAGDATLGYKNFQKGWNDLVGCVASFAPIMVTEIDWAPKKYDATWGKGITGVAGGKGFGANFKAIADKSGNVSWLFFTTASHLLASFQDAPGNPDHYTFLNDPEACPWAMYHWFKDYYEADQK